MIIEDEAGSEKGGFEEQVGIWDDFILIDVETKRDCAVYSPGKACWLVDDEAGGEEGGLEEQVGIWDDFVLIDIDIETEQDCAVDPPGKACWLVKDKAGGEKGGLKEQVGEVADQLIGIASSATFLSSSMMALFGLNLRVFLLAMYDDIDELQRACAFMIPNRPVMSMQGKSVMRFEMTLLPSAALHRSSNCLASSSRSFFSSSISSSSRPSLPTQTSFLPSNSLS